MTKYEAKRIIQQQHLRWGQIREVLREARRKMSDHDWASRSVTNKSMSKAAVFNVFWKGIANKEDSDLVEHSRVWFVGANILREFGVIAGYFPVREKKDLPEIHHEEPMEI